MTAPGAPAQPLDSSIPPYVPPEAERDVRAVLRTPWARRWALVVLMLMLAWTAVAWWLNTRHHEARVASVVVSATARANANEMLVEDGLRQGLALSLIHI